MHRDLRDMLFEQAETLEVGPLTETLKWGQPAYLTQASGAGTTVRLAWTETAPEVFQVLVHCQTTLIGEWRLKFDDVLEFDGNRAIRLRKRKDLPRDILAQCFAAALTYRRR